MTLKSHWAYLKYIARHKFFVFVAGRRLGVSYYRLLKHDWTKFLPSEWTPYVRSFYNYDGSSREWKSQTKEEKDQFNNAWNHHQKSNDHHWQYWTLLQDSDEPKVVSLLIPTECVKEMVADWAGAGRAIKGKWEVCEWYRDNKERMLLEPKTRAYVEWLLGRFQR